ncbi:hypothetical protein KFE25_008748 [Diacronema lutheri]|uniref:PHD-type domain-containing protein n=1 Tax=Diacronema lutheri TaxID=2081491 RepID=A0A8J5XXG1_DIALT|nr:hypothetical protein KFE25_008748 [Diacronema lutheri]
MRAATTRPTRKARGENGVSAGLRSKRERTLGSARPRGSATAAHGTREAGSRREGAPAAEARVAGALRRRPVHREIVLAGGDTTAIEEHVREVRAHLTRMRRADDLLEAYAIPRNAAGIRPRTELDKARAARAKAVEGIVTGMEALASCTRAHGQVHVPIDGILADEIFCSACGGYESAAGNDILLCDLEGCNRAYHQRCIAPAVSELELEADEWFCPVCDAVDALLDSVNEYVGERWGRVEDMFPKERRRMARGGGESDEDEDDEPDEEYVDSERSSEPTPGSESGEDDEGRASGEGSGGDGNGRGEGDETAASGDRQLDEEHEALGPRRSRVDYAALAHEMFGDDEDEDADPITDSDFVAPHGGARNGGGESTPRGARAQPAARRRAPMRPAAAEEQPPTKEGPGKRAAPAAARGGGKRGPREP